MPTPEELTNRLSFSSAGNDSPSPKGTGSGGGRAQIPTEYFRLRREESFRISDFGFVSDFELRISDLVTAPDFHVITSMLPIPPAFR